MPRLFVYLPPLILLMAGLAMLLSPTAFWHDRALGFAPTTTTPNLNEPNWAEHSDATSKSNLTLGTDSPNELETTSDITTITSDEIVYELNQVRDWAANYSPEAALLDSESRAVMCNVDPKDEESCCSARLIQSVLCELALGRRADDAFAAAKAYHQLIAATEGQRIAQQALATQMELVAMAETAASLDIRDGDVMKLNQDRIDLVQAELAQSFSIRKLRQELARVTGRDESEAAVARPIDFLPTTAEPIDTGVAVATALAQRHDLRAVANLCQRMNRCNLPAARQLLGAVSPGVGLSLASLSGKKGLFGCLKDDHSDDDLATRRRQCRDLHRSLSRTIRNQVLQAILDVRLAHKKTQLAFERLELAERRFDAASVKLRIEKAMPGTDVIAELELIQMQGEVVKTQLELALAVDTLHNVRNDPIPGSRY
ncbi:MAG: hypothetical protein AAF539_10390 [Planctomycetota bacterium]